MRVVTFGNVHTTSTRSLRGLFDEAEERVYIPATFDSEGGLTHWPKLSWGDEAPLQLTLGYPARLGALYARQPLLTFVGLVALGWAGGYFTWRWIGQRRR